MADKLAWPRAGARARGVIDGPAGALEVAVERPDSPARGFVLVCHPHPQYGGSLDNKVVYTLARAALEAGLAAVRCNFRGVGASAGAYDGGAGEAADARAASAWAADGSGLEPAGLAGFSFGAAVALGLADALAAPTLITVGLPAEYFDHGLARPAARWLAVFGDADDVIDVRAAIAAVRELEPPVAVEVLHGAGHFLHRRLVDLRGLAVAHWRSDDGVDAD